MYPALLSVFLGFTVATARGAPDDFGWNEDFSDLGHWTRQPGWLSNPSAGASLTRDGSRLPLPHCSPLCDVFEPIQHLVLTRPGSEPIAMTTELSPLSRQLLGDAGKFPCLTVENR